MAVTDIISAQQAVANSYITQAQQFIDAVAQIGQDYVLDLGTLPGLGFGLSGITEDALDTLRAAQPSRPVFASISADGLPIAPTLTLSEIDEALFETPAFFESAPVLNMPLTPSALLPEAPVAPSIADVPIPEAPTVTLPAVPTLLPITLPDAPVIELPAFTGTEPTDELLAPSSTLVWAEQAYASTCLDTLKAKLLNDLEHGTYGIEPSDEQALFDRARDRVNLATRMSAEEIDRRFAAGGFPMPRGAQVAAYQAALQEATNKLADANRDIVLRRSELYVEGRKFTFAQVQGLEQMLLSYHGAVQERALNFAKSAADVALSMFDAQVKAFNGRLEAYRVGAQVFETRMRAVLAQTEVYKTTLEGKRIEGELQRSQVDIYRAQLSGAEAVVALYRTQMDAANVRAQVERTRMDAFRALIDGYLAQVRAKEAEFGMYRAGIEGETAKVTAFKVQVDAFLARVSAVKARADVLLGKLRAETEQAQAKTSLFNSQITAYKANVDTQAETIRQQSEVYRSDNAAYQVQVAALADSFRVRLDEMRQNNSWNAEVVRSRLEEARVRLQALQSTINLKLGASEFGANFYAATIGAALNSIGSITAKIESS
jgi:hypothetical protein